MLILDKRWNCWEISHNERYIATIGEGITIWDRGSLGQIHHFSGVKWIHGGIFVNDDILMVYNGEQKLFFFQISQKKLLWTAPRPRELAVSGDLRCCHIPGTKKVACVAQGKKSLEEHFLLVVDWNTRELSIQRIPDCYRVVSNLVWTPDWGLTFLCSQAKGDNATILYRIFRADSNGMFSILYNGESGQSVLAYSGRYLFLADYGKPTPEAYVYPLEQSDAENSLHLGKPMPVRIEPLLTNGLVGTQRMIFPKICWNNENAGLLIACSAQKWIGVYDFLNQNMIYEQPNCKVYYGELLDGKLLMGCAPGFFAEPMEYDVCKFLN